MDRQMDELTQHPLDPCRLFLIGETLIGEVNESLSDGERLEVGEEGDEVKGAICIEEGLTTPHRVMA